MDAGPARAAAPAGPALTVTTTSSSSTAQSATTTLIAFAIADPCPHATAMPSGSRAAAASDGERCLDGGGAAITDQTLVFSARLMVFVSAVTNESLVTTV
jgi:hypothetical protein